MIGPQDTFWLSKNPVLRLLRRWLSVYPAIYIPFRRILRAETVVQPSTALLIEGFPRTGNTWTEALVREAGPASLELAHHAHAAAHVLRAQQLGVPSMILYRAPDDAVTSLLALYENQLDAKGAYLEYSRFYNAVWPLRGDLVRFYSLEDVTERSAQTIEDLRAHFGLPLSATQITQDAIFARMDAKAERLQRRQSSHSKARPDIDPNLGDGRRDFAQAAIEDRKVAKARAKANKIFARMQSDLGSAT